MVSFFYLFAEIFSDSERVKNSDPHHWPVHKIVVKQFTKNLIHWHSDTWLLCKGFIGITNLFLNVYFGLLDF